MNYFKIFFNFFIIQILLSSIVVVSYAAAPKLFFSDTVDGATSGWEQSASKGAAITVWGYGFGPPDANSKLTVCGVDLLATDSNNVVEWNTINTAGSNDPNDVYTSARRIPRITFHLTSSMTVGDGTIVVTTPDGTSNPLAFHCRERGTNKIMFWSRTGNDNNNGLYATQGPGSNGPKRTLGLIKRELKAGDAAYIRAGVWNEGDTIDAYSNKAVLDFWSTNHANGTANNSILLSSYPGEIAQLGDSTRQGVISRHGSAGDITNHWTFSKFLMRSNYNCFGWPYNSAGSDDHVRIIGNDMSTTAGGKTIAPFTAGSGGQSNFYFLGNHSHDAGVDKRSDSPPTTKGYSFSMSGSGSHNHIFIGYNEFDNNQYGHAFYIYGHYNGDSINDLHIYNNWFHDNSMRGSILGGGDNNGGGEDYGFVDNCYYYNNIISNNGWVGVLVGDGSAHTAGGGGHFYLYNNTFYENGEGAFQIEPATESLILTNNIIVNSSKYFYRDHAPAVSSGTNNLFYGNANSLPNWLSTTVEQDPKFEKPYSGIFTLQPDSPAIDNGTLVSLVTMDFNNATRPQGGKYDIGAIEYDEGGTLQGFSIYIQSINIGQ